MNTIKGQGPTGGVQQTGYRMTDTQFNTVKDLISQFREAKNTNTQTKVVSDILQNLKPEIMARYLVPGPIVAEYIAVPPQTGFDPANFENADGANLANALDTANTELGDTVTRFPDDMVMYYMVAPPPPDPEQAKRFNQINQFDQDLNKVFGALIDTTEKIVDDQSISDAELQRFTNLQVSFNLSARMFYGLVEEYSKDFPMAQHPEEQDWRNFSGPEDRNLPPATTGAAPEVNPATNPLATRLRASEED